MPDALPPGYSLRLATLDDAQTIQAQRDAMFVDMGQEAARLAHIHAASLAWHQRQLQSGQYLGFLLEHGGSVIAGAGLLWQDWPPNPDTALTTRGYVMNVYVHPEHRGQALAKALMQACLDACAERGVNIISLHASEAGRPTYERLGFIATNELKLVVPSSAVTP